MEDNNSEWNIWARDTINKYIKSQYKAQNSKKRWGIFFKSSLLFLLLYFVYTISQFVNIKSPVNDNEFVAMIEINGVIAKNSDVDYEYFIKSIENLKLNKDFLGLILYVNSPGGSPVQADLISTEILNLKSEFPDKKIITVVEDLCASAAYYIAAVSDEIYVNKNSLVGSIGVIINGFGFKDTIDKLGIERRLITSGENKVFLDPFSDAKNKDISYAKKMILQIHNNFINVVRTGRGDKLVDNDEIFSGKIWTGQDSISLGLVDGEESLRSASINIFGTSNIVNFSFKKNFSEQLFENFSSFIKLLPRSF
jgi:protease-4